MINDVTTTPDSPPQFVNLLAQNKDRDMSFKTGQRNPTDLAPFPLKGENPESAFEKVLGIAVDMPNWKVVSANKDLLKIEAVSTSPILRFKDDVVIEIRTEPLAVHMRSKSRLGRSDFGANRKRILEFQKKLN